MSSLLSMSDPAGAINNFFKSIYIMYYNLRNPVFKFLFFFVVLPWYILNILLYVFSFGIISNKNTIVLGGYCIFGVSKVSVNFFWKPVNGIEVMIPRIMALKEWFRN